MEIKIQMKWKGEENKLNPSERMKKERLNGTSINAAG